MQEIIESKLLYELNHLIEQREYDDEDDEKVEYFIMLLLSQGIKTYKSCVILASGGYLENMFINLRNLLEITFKTLSITDNKKEKANRITAHLEQTDRGVKWRADESLQDVLYKVYKMYYIRFTRCII